MLVILFPKRISVTETCMRFTGKNHMWYRPHKQALRRFLITYAHEQQKALLNDCIWLHMGITLPKRNQNHFVKYECRVVREKKTEAT